MKRIVALLAVAASAVCCIFLAEHRVAAEAVDHDPGRVTTCQPRGDVSGGLAWSAYVCTTTRPASSVPVYRTFTGGARGLSRGSGAVFAEILAIGGDGGEAPETVIVNGQAPVMRRPPRMRAASNAEIRTLYRMPDPAPAVEVEHVEPQMILVAGLDQPGYDAFRRIFFLPAEVSAAERVKMMFVLMAERR